MKTLWSFPVCLLLVVCLGLGPVTSTAQTTAAALVLVQKKDAKKLQDDQKSEDQQQSDKTKSDKQADSDQKSLDQETSEPETSDAEPDAQEKPQRKTHTVQAKPLKTRLETDATFVANDMTAIELDPESWSSFKITEIVPHGKTVHKGEVLVQFDGEELKQSIEELELEQRLSELSIIKSEQELPRLEKSIKDSFEQAERALSEAKLDYKNYQETDRDLMVRSLKMRLKASEQSTENAREELRQLEKMYEADDLTEETEEIVLKRQRAAVEQANFMLEQAKLNYERNMDLFLPRNDIQQKESLDRIEMAFARAKTSLETDLNRARYELEKAKRKRAESLEKHAKLTSDLSLLTLKSPADGVVYYGSCTDGEWSDMANLIGKLKPEESAPTGSTLMTIVQPGSLHLVTEIKEANRTEVEVGQTADIKPTAANSPKLEARVSSISPIPVDSGKFGLQLELTSEELPEWLVAGMTGKAKITTYETDAALMVPKDAVHSEEADEDEKYVWLIEGDQVTKRSVTIGKTKGDDMEVLEGLEAGDEISLADEEGSDQ